MDEQLGRLVDGVRAQPRDGQPPRSSSPPITAKASAITARSQHGNLLYQSTMHVPLVVVGPGVTPGAIDDAGQHAPRLLTRCSTGPGSASAAQPARTGDGAGGRARRGDEAVPRVRLAAAGHGRRGTPEGDPRGQDRGLRPASPIPARAKNLGAGANLPGGAAQGARRLSRAVAGGRARAREPGRRGAPQAREPRLRQRERAAGRAQGRAAAGRHDRRCSTCSRRRPACSSTSEYARGRSRCSRRSCAADPNNLDAALRLATAHSSLGHEAQALAAFKTRRRDRAAVAGRPNLPRAALRARQGLAAGRAAARAGRRRDARSAAGGRGAGHRARASGRRGEALALRQKIYALRTPTAAELVHLGQLAMQRRQTTAGDRGVRGRARRQPGGVHERSRARRALPRGAPLRRGARRARSRPRVAPGLPDGALQARAGERAAERAGRAARIDAARQHADATTRALIERERLFEEVTSRQHAVTNGQREPKPPATRSCELLLELQPDRELEAPRVEEVPRRAERRSCATRGSML